MLQIAPSGAPVHMTGRKFDRLVQTATPSKRALLADDLRAGRIVLNSLTTRQANAVARANHNYASIVRRLTAAEKHGVDHEHYRLCKFAKVPATDELVDRVVARLGVARVFAALDRATAPTNGNGHAGVR
jgi:hypothetical protein